MRKPCFVLFYLMPVCSLLYGALSSMLYCSHSIVFMCWTCIHSYVCSDDHLLCYVVIVVISIWLFWCMIKLLICFTSCLLDHNLFVTLFLSFYYLLYLEGLMCFVQVFQVTSIYIPSSSQLLRFMIGGVIWCGRKRERVLCYINYVCFVNSSW